jgi:hypothetical protein
MEKLLICLANRGKGKPLFPIKFYVLMPINEAGRSDLH